MPVRDSRWFKIGFALLVLAGTLVTISVTEHLGHAELARPIMIAIGALAIIVIIYPELYSKLWFWMVMTAFTGLHLALILLVHWSPGWVPSAVIFPFCLADLAIMIWIISFIQRRRRAQAAAAQTP
jgi:hypothetical protein